MTVALTASPGWIAALAVLVLFAAVAWWRARRVRAAVRASLQGGDAARLPRWLQPLGTELARRQHAFEQADAAYREALAAQAHQAARAAALHEIARDAQLGLGQARGGLEQLRAALPQRTLQRNMERARARVELDRLLESVVPTLAALRQGAAGARALARDGAAAQSAALAATEALQLLAINARVALERGASDELADVAVALERRCAELGAASRAGAVAPTADAVVGQFDAALRALDAAVAQARSAPVAPTPEDADLEADLAALARDLGHTMLQLQALLRESGSSAQSEEADVRTG